MNYYVRIGILTAFIIMIFHLAVFYSGSFYTSIGRYALLLDLLIMLPGIFWGIKSKKERDLKQNYILKEAIKSGLQVVTAVSFTVAFFTYIFFLFEIPAILTQTQNYLVSVDTPAASISGILTNAQNYFSPFHQATISLFMHLIPGVIISVIFATLLGQKK
ncbi:MAG: DUF4199 family protein [Bacteroidia bacterium]